MKYFYKLLLSMLFLLTLALSLMEYASVTFTFDQAYQRECERVLSEHRLIRHTVRSAIFNGNVGSDFSALAEIGSNAASLMDENCGLMLWCGGDVYFCELATEPYFHEPMEAAVNIYVKTSAERRYLIVESGFSGLNLVTEHEITKIFTEAEELRTIFNRLFIAILCGSIAASMILSYFLTKPLSVLRRASKSFSDGNYKARARIDRRDEVGELAKAYNAMAETIEVKIHELEESAQRQKRFTASFAHELKTPMTSIIGYADTIYQKDLPPDRIRQSAWYIMNEGMRLEALSFKLMDLIALDKDSFILEETDIYRLLRDTAASILPSVKKKQVKFSLQAEHCWVRVEYDLFKTLLLNILDNALKSDSTHVRLKGQIDGDNYTISVTDNGRGIPADELDKITEAFYMVDKSRSRSQHGAGLGLALCQRIAELHGTVLKFSSVVGVGTDVSLSLSKAGDSDEE